MYESELEFFIEDTKKAADDKANSEKASEMNATVGMIV